MSEDNKTNLTPDTEGVTPSDGEKKDAQLNEELEKLRETFQSTYNETAAEAAQTTDEPVIQGLDYNADEDDADSDSDSDSDNEISRSPSELPKNDKKKAKKRRSKGHIACIIIMIIAIFNSLILGAGVYSLISTPDLADYLSNFQKAARASSAEDKVKYLKAALEVCSEGNKLDSNRQELIEEIVYYTCKSEGYSAAKKFFDENGTEDMKKSPKTSGFKEFLSIGDKISEIADKAFDAVNAYVGKDGDPDFTKLAKELGASEIILSDVENALKSIYEGSVAAQTAKSETEIQLASKNYLTAYQSFSSMGAACQTLLEKTALLLFDNGYAYESNIIIKNYMTKDMLEKPVTEEFAQMQKEIASASAFKGDIFEIASEQFNAGKTSADDFSSLVTGDGIGDKIKASISSMIADTVEALENEKGKNLTRASSLLSLALDSAKSLNLSVRGLAWETTKVLLNLGNLRGANEIADGYLTEEDVMVATAEQSVLYSNVTTLYNAQKSANDVFYSAYSSAYYSGKPLDKTAVYAELDKLITSNSSVYDKAMVAYYKYITELSTDKDTAVAQKYLDEYVSVLRDFPLIYSYDLVGQYVSQKNYEEAFKLVDKVLDINKADDFAGRFASLRERMNGNVEKALETAEESMTLSGETQYAAYEAALCSLILKKYDEATDLASKIAESGLSYDLCDLVKVLEHLYTEKETETAKKLASLVATIDNTMNQNNVTVSDNAKAIIDGTKTVEEVLMTGTYNFS